MTGPAGHGATGPAGHVGTSPAGPGAVGRPGRGRVRRLRQDLLLVVAMAGLVLAGLSLLTLSREEALDPGTGRTGEATVVACRRVGPVSGSGLGYWWTCTVEVRWMDGGHNRYVVPGSRFTPADRERPVAVRETARGSRGNLAVATRPVRADRAPRVGILAAGLLTFLAGALCAVRPAVDVIRLLARAGRQGAERVRRVVRRARRRR